MSGESVSSTWAFDIDQQKQVLERERGCYSNTLITPMLYCLSNIFVLRVIYGMYLLVCCYY